VLDVQHITTLDLPELQPYRTMRRQMEHRRQGIFVAEGEKVVRRLLESRFEVKSALLPQKWFDDLKPALEARADSVQVYIAEKKLLETLTGFSMYQGLLALGKIPPQPSLEEVLRKSEKQKLFVAVDGLSSAENLGAIVRNCCAFGVNAVITSETCTSPYMRRAVRSSMGTIFELPVIESAKLSATLAQLKDYGIKCIAAHPHTEKRFLPEADLKPDCCIVLGSEGYGISAEVLRQCDESVAIEISATVDSLNVASAGGIFLYEASRQRLGRLS
jgi:tRNA G18 (ribose-2'-O)-methylase SpoU